MSSTFKGKLPDTGREIQKPATSLPPPTYATLAPNTSKPIKDSPSKIRATSSKKSESSTFKSLPKNSSKDFAGSQNKSSIYKAPLKDDFEICKTRSSTYKAPLQRDNHKSSPRMIEMAPPTYATLGPGSSKLKARYSASKAPLKSISQDSKMTGFSTLKTPMPNDKIEESSSTRKTKASLSPPNYAENSIRREFPYSSSRSKAPEPLPFDSSYTRDSNMDSTAYAALPAINKSLVFNVEETSLAHRIPPSYDRELVRRGQSQDLAIRNAPPSPSKVISPFSVMVPQKRYTPLRSGDLSPLLIKTLCRLLNADEAEVFAWCGHNVIRWDNEEQDYFLDPLWEHLKISQDRWHQQNDRLRSLRERVEEELANENQKGEQAVQQALVPAQQQPSININLVQKTESSVPGAAQTQSQTPAASASAPEAPQEGRIITQPTIAPVVIRRSYWGAYEYGYGYGYGYGHGYGHPWYDY